jgi:serine/threonine protein kinase
VPRPSVGEIVNGKYRLMRLIGEGGMGSVFEAVHEYLGSAVALKFLNLELARRAGLVARFLQEARVSASIRSPHVVLVSDVDQTPDGLPYLVMELLEGESLQAVLTRSGRLPRATALDFAAQVLNGLEAAHAKGVVHRDLKPDNVFVVPTQQGPLLKLLDFGIAKLRTSEDFQRGLTRPGALMGTPEYMAPEQAISADLADHRADLFSVGVLLFEMLTGTRPVTGDDPRVMAASVLAGQVRSLRELDPDAPEALAAVLQRALAGRIEDRFQSAAEMRTALLPFFTLSMNAAGGRPSHLQPTPTPSGTAPAPPMQASHRPPPTQPGDDAPVGGGVAPTLPPSEPPRTAPPVQTGAFRTGTVLGEPAQGLGGDGPTAEMPPLAFDATAPGPTVGQGPLPRAYGPAATPAPMRKKSRSALSILGIIAAVCGAVAAVGVIGALVYLNHSADSDDTPSIGTTATAPPANVSPNEGSTTAETVVTPIATPPSTTPPGVTTAKTPLSDAGAGGTADAAGADAGQDAGFPSLPPFPSAFPSAIPSNIIPTLPPLPSGLPTIPIPGWPPPP